MNGGETADWDFTVFLRSFQGWVGTDAASIAASLIDFVVITLLIYGVLYFLRSSRGANVLFGIIAFLLLSQMLVLRFNLKVVGALLSGLWTIIGMSLIVIFQPEIRRFFAHAGGMFSGRQKFVKDSITQVVNACVQMSDTCTGALIVFERNIGLEGIISSSVPLNARINSLLLQSIFFKNSPLHDCAVIIRENKIVAAKAVLPLAQLDEFDPSYRSMGTRHRSALGLTEETDAVVVVVSEETGKISIASKGRILSGYTRTELERELNFLLIERDANRIAKLLKRFRKENETVPDPESRQEDLFENLHASDTLRVEVSHEDK